MAQRQFACLPPVHNGWPQLFLLLLLLLSGSTSVQVVVVNDSGGDGECDDDDDDDNDNEFIKNDGEFGMVGVGVGDGWIESNRLW